MLFCLTPSLAFCQPIMATDVEVLIPKITIEDTREHLHILTGILFRRT